MVIIHYALKKRIIISKKLNRLLNINNDSDAKSLFDNYIETLEKSLIKYDTGFWSLYEQAGLKMKMLASPFYHNLHISQLKVMNLLTNKSIFQQTAERWENYKEYPINRYKAIAYKSLFKLIYY